MVLPTVGPHAICMHPHEATFRNFVPRFPFLQSFLDPDQVVTVGSLHTHREKHNIVRAKAQTPAKALAYREGSSLPGADARGLGHCGCQGRWLGRLAGPLADGT